VPNLVEVEHDELEDTTLRAFRIVFGVTLVAVAAAAVVGMLLIPVVFGSRFSSSRTPFLILLPGALGYAGQKVFSSALTGLGRPGRSSFGPLMAVITGLALDALLIPAYGANGAALAASAAFGAGGLAAMVAFHASLPFRFRELVPGRADVRSAGAAIDGWRARRRGPGGASL
jgi:O-antigen/teichoic acid export membrane protein